jgi:hypothetical protein
MKPGIGVMAEMRAEQVGMETVEARFDWRVRREQIPGASSA